MLQISRRMFLEQTLLASAAMAAVPSREVLAADAAPQSASPSERLSVAVIGVNGRGGDHARAYAARKDCFISYICDCDSVVGERVVKKYEKAKFVQDLRRIMDDKSVDIVSIATPNHWHSLAGIWAMQAGKDVYVEKPVSHHISEGRRLVQASRKYNRICQGGTQHRSAGCNRAAAEYVRSGKLGQVKLAHLCTYRPRSSIGAAGQYQPPASVDYNLWAGPAPMELPLRRKNFHYDWHWFWDWGGGELANNSIHCVDTMRLIADLKGLGKGVMSYGGRVGIVDCAETPSTQFTIHDFGPITVVQEVRNLKTPAPKRGGAIVVVGTEGYVASNFGSAAVYDPAGKLVQKLTGPNIDHFGNFIQAVRSRKREEQTADIEQGHISTSIVHVANISQRLGKPTSPGEIQKALEALKVNENVVETFAEIRQHLKDNGVDIEKTPLALGPWIGIDSDNERFIGNPAADAMLTREDRKPFVVPAGNQL